MEEGGQPSRPGIKPGDIWALVTVAMQTRECEVFRISDAAVLAGDNVINLKWSGKIQLRRATVFAKVAGAASNLGSQRIVHERYRFGRRRADFLSARRARE